MLNCPPQEIKYRDYRNFSEECFRSCLEQKLSTKLLGDLEQLEDIFDVILAKHAPFKSAIIRWNKKPHSTKQLRKEIMVPNRLKNTANRAKAPKYNMTSIAIPNKS